MVSRETSGDGSIPPELPAWLEPASASLDRYARILTGPGIERGLLGPREAPRIWERHILNCAVVADPQLGLVPSGARVADVGSGAGLPGVAWALARPDLTVILIESLLRRATFLTECVHELALGDRVHVVRDRAESITAGPQGGRPGSVDLVTARAVAPLGTLASWAATLLGPAGSLVALKGESAGEELDRDRVALTGLGFTDTAIKHAGVGVVDPATTVVVATFHGHRPTAQ